MSIVDGLLPQALAPLGRWHQWILWRAVPDPTKPGKTKKLPLDHRTGITGSAIDPANHLTYPDAVAAAKLWPGTFLGFVLTDDDPFFFIDIDGHYDGSAWSPLAAQIHGVLSSCCVEVSHSNRGLHIIGTAKLADHSCKNIPSRLELYTTDRFIALTGNCYAGGSADAQPGAIHQLAATYFPPNAAMARDVQWSDEPRPEWRGPDDDDELIARALRSRTAAAVFGQGVTFKHLWEADAEALAKRWPGDSAEGYDRSQADASLAAMLAWWTGGNHERIDRIMRRSALARDKWDRSSPYLEPTILRAAAQVTGCYQEPVSEPPPPPIVVPAAGVTGDVAAIEPPGQILALVGNQHNDKNDTMAIEYYLMAMQVRPAYDEFSNAIIMQDGRPLTDQTEREMWITLRQMRGIKYPENLFGAVLRNIAWRNRFHPVRDYLDMVEQQHDGRPRIDTWLTDYLSVPATPYTQAVGRLWLVAACRRVRQPGAKFDEMPVLEGPQGTLKSSAMAALVPVPSWFTDSLTLNMRGQDLLELTQGKWIVEAAELSNMKRAGVQHVRALLARQFDRARPAYGKHVEERGRQWVPFGSTNDDSYMEEFERRLWPLVPGTIHLDAIARDRGQLWAEASLAERAGESIRLDPSLWEAAREAQTLRIVENPYHDVLQQVLFDKTGRVRGYDLMMFLRIPLEKHMAHRKELGDAMKALGWISKLVRVEEGPARFFVKGDPAREIGFIGGNADYIATQLRSV